MLYRPRNFIGNLEDRKINEKIYVKDRAIFLQTDGAKFKYEFGNWYIFTDRWINLQGGVPDYTIDQPLDEGIFEALGDREEE